MSDAFISYSRLDKEFVGKLREALANKGQEVWIDWESIPASQLWWQEIRKGIAKANNFVLIMSPNSMSSPICQMEIEYAREVGKRIIPVVHAEFERKTCLMSIAERLATGDETATREIWGTRQAHDLYDANLAVIKPINYFFFKADADFQSRFDELFKIIDTDPVYKEKHTTLGLRAAEWDRRGRDASFVLLGNELRDAEQWQRDAGTKEPAITKLQADYIDASRKASNRRRNITLSGVLIVVAAFVFAISASLVGANAVNQVNIAGLTLTPVPATLNAVASAVADAQAEQYIIGQFANASVMIRNKQNRAALQIGNALINAYPHKKSAYMSRGLIYSGIGQADKAIEDYSKVLELDPNDRRAYANRGISYADLKQYDKALSDFDKALELDPNNALSYTNRGLTYYHLQQYDKALADHNKALEIDPNNADAYRNRGLTYYDLQQYDKALADLNKALEIDPTDALPYTNRGRIYYSLQQYDKALADYSKALEIDPNNANTYVVRGSIYYSLEQHDKALADYSKALVLDPENVFAYTNRALTYFSLKQYDNASADYDLAIAINPESTIAYWGRGNVYWEQGKTALALADYRRYQELTGKLEPFMADRIAQAEATLTPIPTFTATPTATH